MGASSCAVFSCCYFHRVRTLLAFLLLLFFCHNHAHPNEYPTNMEELEKQYRCVTKDVNLTIGDHKVIIRFVEPDGKRRLLLNIDDETGTGKDHKYAALTPNNKQLNFSLVADPPNPFEPKCKKDLNDRKLVILPKICIKNNDAPDSNGISLKCNWTNYVRTLKDKEGKDVYLTTGNIRHLEAYKDKKFKCKFAVLFPHGYHYLAKKSDLNTKEDGSTKSAEECLGIKTPTTFLGCLLNWLFILLWGLAILFLIILIALIVSCCVCLQKRRRLVDQTATRMSSSVGMVTTGQTMTRYPDERGASVLRTTKEPTSKGKKTALTINVSKGTSGKAVVTATGGTRAMLERSSGYDMSRFQSQGGTSKSTGKTSKMRKSNEQPPLTDDGAKLASFENTQQQSVSKEEPTYDMLVNISEDKGSSAPPPPSKKSIKTAKAEVVKTKKMEPKKAAAKDKPKKDGTVQTLQTQTAQNTSQQKQKSKGPKTARPKGPREKVVKVHFCSVM